MRECVYLVGSPCGFWVLVKSHFTFSSCLFLSLTYWASVPYKDITGWGLWGFVKSHSTLFCIFLLAYWQVLHIDIQHLIGNHGMGIGIAPWGFWGFWNPIQHFFTCLVVSITYWESVPYKKSQDGDYGDLSNPIWHFLHFSFLLVGKSYILIISTLREITGWGTWGL